MNVEQIQANLALKGFGQLDIDGDIGPKTIAAIKEFQKCNNLEIDGDVGPETLKALLSPIKGNLALRAVQLMVSAVGVREKGNNSGPEVDRYLASVGLNPGYYWCAAFVYYYFEIAAKEMAAKNPLVKTGSTIKLMNNFQGIKTLKPQSGDVAIIRLTDLTGHEFAVISVVGDRVWTVEGNTNNNGSANGDGVYIRNRAITQATAYLRVA